MKDGWLAAFAPATIANFGSGFDAFAAAVRRAGARTGSSRALGDIVAARRTKRTGVRIVAITGDGGRLPASASRNCAAVAAAAVLRRARAPFGLDLVLDKGLPLSSGLGSSAASAAAGASAAALAVSGTLGAKQDLLAPALDGEHIADGSWHGDNVFASLLGGGVIVVATRQCEVVRLKTPARLRLVAVHPAFELPTRRARAALPANVPLLDAAAQVAQFGALVAAWTRGDAEGIGRGLADRLAVPYRARLLPGYTSVVRAAEKAGAFGVTFAGAGPTVLAIAPRGDEEKIGRAIRNAFKSAGLASETWVCAVDDRGARKVEAP